MSVNHYTQPVNNRNFKHATLLIVEDNDDHSQLIQLAVKQTLPEIQLIRVADAGQALSYLDNCLLTGRDLPKLILLDLYLPDREDGWGLLKQIKYKSSSYKQVPVVILSNSSNPKDVSQSYFYGSTSYITKPVSRLEWQKYIQALRWYWWETVTLPSA